MKAKMVVQVKLRAPNNSGWTERICFLDNAKIRKGSKVTLKNSEDPKRKWEVIWVSEQPLDVTVLHTDWNVGGLQ